MKASLKAQASLALQARRAQTRVQIAQEHLDLARADFVQRMPSDLVQRSKMKVPGAAFHFVVDPSI